MSWTNAHRKEIFMFIVASGRRERNIIRTRISHRNQIWWHLFKWNNLKSSSKCVINFLFIWKSLFMFVYPQGFSSHFGRGTIHVHRTSALSICLRPTSVSDCKIINNLFICSAALWIVVFMISPNENNRNGKKVAKSQSGWSSNKGKSNLWSSLAEFL